MTLSIISKLMIFKELSVINFRRYTTETSFSHTIYNCINSTRLTVVSTKSLSYNSCIILTYSSVCYIFCYVKIRNNRILLTFFYSLLLNLSIRLKTCNLTWAVHHYIHSLQTSICTYCLIYIGSQFKTYKLLIYYLREVSH